MILRKKVFLVLLTEDACVSILCVWTICRRVCEGREIRELNGKIKWFVVATEMVNRSGIYNICKVKYSRKNFLAGWLTDEKNKSEFGACAIEWIVDLLQKCEQPVGGMVLQVSDQEKSWHQDFLHVELEIQISFLTSDLRTVEHKNLELSGKDKARNKRLGGGIYRHLKS